MQIFADYFVFSSARICAICGFKIRVYLRLTLSFPDWTETA